MPELNNVIKEVESSGITILFCEMPETIGRHSIIFDKPCIFIHQELSDIEKINVILHEQAHFLNQDLTDTKHLPDTFTYRLEAAAEKARIIDFMNLINQEYPINHEFNYINYMKASNIPDKYENFVKEKAKQFYLQNLENNRI